MYLRSLALADFRNYEKAETEFSATFNFIYGLNGQGKTNFLEAIYLVCLGRTFRSAKNQELVRKGFESFTVSSTIRKDNEIEKRVIVNYIKDGKKQISIDRKRLNSHSAIFGEFPVVIMAPEEFKITTGGPSERRRFFDILLSQVSPTYLGDLQDYHRIVKQRNRILQSIRDGISVTSRALDPWTENLVSVGSRLIRYREQFVAEFSKMVNGIYQSFSETKNDLTMRIRSSVGSTNGNDCEERFAQALEQVYRKEQILGATLVGPHRDEIEFSINDMILRDFGSRGEHKSVLISLKIAEFKYLRQKKKETPILLLDDCYSELDDYREQSVFDVVEGVGQTFLTTPREKFFRKYPSLSGAKANNFFVENGQIAICKN